MKYRNFRIAWSVAWAVMAVLLIALWVRSYLVHSPINYPSNWQHAWRVNYATANMAPVAGDYVTWLDSKKRSWLLFSTGGTVIASVAPQSTPRFAVAGLRFNARSGRWTYEFPQSAILGFSYLRSPLSTAVQIPYWFLCLAATIAGVVPWLHRFRFRFNLRTLLIAMTVIALLLGSIVWMSRAG